MKMFDGKYADETAILWLWRKINLLFVKKDGNKVLSDINFTAADKAKLDAIEANANNYVLPTASSQTLGGIKIGNGLTIDENGVVSTTGQGGSVAPGTMHKLRFGMDQVYEYDGSADVTVPVYMGEYH